jgi:hypothetical protein
MTKNQTVFQSWNSEVITVDSYRDDECRMEQRLELVR